MKNDWGELKLLQLPEAGHEGLKILEPNSGYHQRFDLPGGEILMPETGVDLSGGFGVLDISPSETWVISSEMAFPASRRDEPNRVLLAKVLWKP
jgi:hypothetical protein